MQEHPISVGSVTALCPAPSEGGPFLPSCWGHPISSHPCAYDSPGPEGENHPRQLCLAGSPMAAARNIQGDSPLAHVKPQPTRGCPLLPALAPALADEAGAESAPPAPPSLLLERQKASQKQETHFLQLICQQLAPRPAWDSFSL